TLGGRVARHDDAAARSQRGVRAVVVLPPPAGGTGGVAVIADHPWRAQQAAERLVVDWDHGALADFDSAETLKRFAEAARGGEGKGHAFFQRGDSQAALAGAATRLQAEYSAPYLAHAALEPINCTVL